MFLEGSVRVPAFAYWPGVIAPGQVAGDMFHVTDLFPTFARLANATAGVPTDRVIDGLDQTALLLGGDTRGRRDYAHVYVGPQLGASVKQQFKRHWMQSAGSKPGMDLVPGGFYDLYKDPREEHPAQTQMLWAWPAFDQMKRRHMDQVSEYPHSEPRAGRAYEGLQLKRRACPIYSAGDDPNACLRRDDDDYDDYAAPAPAPDAGAEVDDDVEYDAAAGATSTDE